MTRLLPLVTLLFAVATFGATGSGTIVSGFYVVPAEGDHGFGVAIDHSWAPHFSTYLGISAEPTVVTRLVGSTFGQVPVTTFDDVHPVDFLLRYQYSQSSRIRPYAGLGMRFIRSGATDNYRPELNAGLRFAVTNRISVEADWKRLFNQRDLRDHVHDGQFGEGGSSRLAVGLGYTF
jgi:hypothetical protein